MYHRTVKSVILIFCVFILSISCSNNSAKKTKKRNEEFVLAGFILNALSFGFFYSSANYNDYNGTGSIYYYPPTDESTDYKAIVHVPIGGSLKDFSITSGSLPSFLSFNSQNGEIKGNPNGATGKYKLTVQANLASGRSTSYTFYLDYKYTESQIQNMICESASTTQCHSYNSFGSSSSSSSSSTNYYSMFYCPGSGECYNDLSTCQLDPFCNFSP